MSGQLKSFGRTKTKWPESGQLLISTSVASNYYSSIMYTSANNGPYMQNYIKFKGAGGPMFKT